jgi:putative hydrolase of the HAD superfamily
MKYKAIIFDLYGTLVDNFEGARSEAMYRQMADWLGLDGETFGKTWISDPFSWRRASGQYDTLEDCLRDVCQAMGVTYDRTALLRVLNLRMQVTRDNMTPRPDTVQTLQTLRQAGRKIGLVSDCSWETPVYWPHTPMAPLVDAAIFSCTAKMKKPDPRLYSLVCEKLSVQPCDCLYIGDCGSDELAGARQAGMDAALICVPYERETVMCRPEAQRWDGPRVTSVSGVLGLVQNGRGA